VVNIQVEFFSVVAPCNVVVGFQSGSLKCLYPSTILHYVTIENTSTGQVLHICASVNEFHFSNHLTNFHQIWHENLQVNFILVRICSL
jgi:hypothetical protein